MSKIKVVVCRCGQDPVVEEIDDTLEAKQAVVGGLIECIQLDETTDLWCNEEGLFTCQGNRLLVHQGRHQPINGDFFIAGHDGDGKTIDLERSAHWRNVAAGWPMAILSLV